jgi:Flp pilus assembly pilin Flp
VQTPGSSLESAVKRIGFLSIAPNIAAKTVFRLQAGVFLPPPTPENSRKSRFLPCYSRMLPAHARICHIPASCGYDYPSRVVGSQNSPKTELPKTIPAIQPGFKEISMLNQLVRRLWCEQEGQDIAEYAVMLAVILVIVVGTIRLIGSNANNVFSSVASSIQ